MSAAWRVSLVRLAVAGAFLLVWDLGSRAVDSRILLPSPTDVLAALNVNREILGAAFGSSLKLYLIGLTLAIVMGVAVGAVLGASRLIGAMFDPIVNAFYVTPRIVLVPLVIGWFGIFDLAKVVLVIAVCIFEVLLFTRDGIRSLSDTYTEVADVFEAGPWRRLIDIFIPGAAPAILTGVRLAAGRAVIGVVVAEFFTAIFAPTDGVAAFVRLSAGKFQTSAALAGVAVLIAFGVLTQAVIALVERRVITSRTMST